MKKTAIFYGSSTGNTEATAKEMAEKLNADIFDTSNDPIDKLSEYNNLIFGTSTWGDGDLQDDWDGFISAVENADLSEKTVAIFGFGDGGANPDTFVNGIGAIYNVVKEKGCKIVGFTSTEGYDYDSSEAEVDGKFIGLPLDDENQGNLTDERVDSWIKEIEQSFN